VQRPPPAVLLTWLAAELAARAEALSRGISRVLQTSSHHYTDREEMSVDRLHMHACIHILMKRRMKPSDAATSISPMQHCDMSGIRSACLLMDGASASLVHLQARPPRSSYTHVNIKSANAQLVGAHTYVLLPSHNSCCGSSAAPAHCPLLPTEPHQHASRALSSSPHRYCI
jgi:hypothetical protein